MSAPAPKKTVKRADRPTVSRDAPSPRKRPPLRRVKLPTAALCLIAGLATLYGVAFDRSLRADPFGGPISVWDWISTRQPARELSTVPVAPMGAAGELSWRPATSTRWVVSGVEALGRDPAPEPSGAASSMATLSVCGEADVYCPVTAQNLAAPSPTVPPATMAPEKMSRPSGSNEGLLLRIAFDGEVPNAQQSKEPPRQSKAPPEPSKVPAYDKSPEVTKAPTGAPAAGQQVKRPPRPRPKPAPQPAAQEAKLPPAPEPLAERARLGPTVTGDPPAALKVIAPLLGAQPAPAASGVGAYAWGGCSPDGLVCLLTDGRQASAFSADGGKTLSPAPMAFAAQPPPLVLRDRVLGVRLGGSTGVAAENGAPAFANRQSGLASPLAAGTLSELIRVDGQLYHSGSEDPFLRLLAAQPALIASVQSARCYASGGGRCLALFGRDQVAVYRGTLEAGSTKLRQLPSRAPLRSGVLLDADRGYVSSAGSAEGPPELFRTLDGGDTWTRLKYAAAPAPWTYAAATVFLFSLVGVAGALLRRRDEPLSGIETAGVSDMPIGWTDPDPLKIKPLALALSRFVRNSQTKPPLTIAISGVWGSGKSSLMNLVREDLAARGVRPVWFNAWHHQKEEHLLAALLENIRSQATPPVWTLSGLDYRFRIWRRRKADVAKVVAVAGVAALAAFLIVTLAPSLDVKNPALADLLAQLKLEKLGVPAGLISFLGVAGPLMGRMGLTPAAILKLGDNASLGQLSGQLGFRQKFADEFGAASQALRVGTDAGLVIFIDDLDRCRPAQLMEVLEAVNFLATAGPCFIFLGMDEARVRDCIATQSPIMDVAVRRQEPPERQADAYLHKLINVTVRVPEATEEGTLGLIDVEPSTPTPVWPGRLRRWARAAPDVVAPIAIVALLATWAGLEISDRLARVTAAAEAASTPVAAPATSTPPAAPAATTAANAGEAPNTPAPAAASAAEPAPAASIVETPPSPARNWLIALLTIGPLALAAILALLVLTRRAVVAAYDHEEDSGDFKEALRIWHPLVYETEPTPRGVKRHQNRLRLQAMRLRPVDETPDWLDRLATRGEAAAAPSGPAKPIDDELLVALAALQEAEHGLLDDALHGRLGKARRDAEADRRAAAAAAALARFQAQFPQAWPPTSEQLGAFRAMESALADEEPEGAAAKAPAAAAS